MRRARPGEGHEGLLDVAAVAVPALIAAGLCAYELGTRSLWLDEAATASIAAQHGGALGAALARDGGNMLGYYALMHVLVGVFGRGAVLLRIPSVIATATTVAVTGTISLRLWDRRLAWTAALLTAVSLTLVYWGQDARAYAPMMALIAGSFLALVWLLEGEEARAVRWVTYVVLTVAAVYAGLEAVLVVPAQLAVLLWRRDRARSVISGALVTAMACVPLAVLAAQRGSGQLFWVPSPSLRTAKQVLQALTSSGLQPGYYSATGDALLILSLVVLAGGAVLAVRCLRSRARERWRGGLVLAWVVLPPILILLISLAGHSIFQARYVLVSLPAVGILIGWTLRMVPQAAAAGLLVALLVLRAVTLAPSYGVSTERWRAASAFVTAHSRSGDCIAFYPLDARMPFEYYRGASGRLPEPILPAVAWSRIRPYVEEYRTLSPGELRVLPARCSRLWLVWSHEGRIGGPPVSAEHFRRLIDLRHALALRFPRRVRYVFGRASPVSVELFIGSPWPTPSNWKMPLLTRVRTRSFTGAA